ncbi:MAG TPA: 30S ribosomal protein S9 [Candidatus Altiarchaeales archaeon]|nr:30S ribosomal protein S9 [Candidatus Altiarchaeales archaeon]
MEGKISHSAGKRRCAIARTTIQPGKGVVKINGVNLEVFEPKAAREKIRVPLILASRNIDLKTIDVTSKSNGGGVIGTADAIASSIARALVEYSEDDSLLTTYVNYDRTLIAGDHRQKETRKPSQSSKGARHKRQKSYR